MKQHHRAHGHLIFFILIFMALFIVPFFFPSLRQYASPSTLRELLLQTGISGYVVTILLLILSIPLPIPSSSVILASGYVYGIIIGSLLSLTGIIIGSTISFLLIRKYGKPLVEKLVDNHHIAHFQHIFKKRGPVAALICFILPIFPSDAIVMLLGLTNIRYSLFLVILTLGHIPRILLTNSIGNDLHAGITARTIIIGIVALLLIVIAIFREPLKKFFFKELQELEHEAKVIENEVEGELGMKKKMKGKCE